MRWTDLITAVGLLLVLEGIMPFLNPSRVRRLMADISRLDERILRLGGLVSMIIGLVVLYFVR